MPTLGRPASLQRVVDNIAEVTTTPYRIVFVCECDDPASYEAAEATGAAVLYNQGDPSYANSLQTAYENDDSPLFVAANDDFNFRPGWDTESLAVMRSEPWVRVVGLNDGNPSCNFSTIALVDRRYIVEQSGVIDMPGRVFYPYKHNYVDTEFFCTAVKRGVFKPAREALIVHHHPDFGFCAYDQTYMKSRASFSQDAAKFESRRHLWTT